MSRPQHVLAPQGILDFADALSREREMLKSLAAFGDKPPAQALVWRTSKALIVPRGMPARSSFADAVREMERLGWPVHERDTGGDLTPQAPGVVNISIAFRDASGTRSIAAAYERLLKPVLAFLREELGIEAYASAIEGSFCDGAYNVAVAGRKLAGTAQRWRMVRTGQGENAADILAHVALMSSMPLENAIGAINAFYRICGIGKTIETARHIDLAELAGAAHADPELIAAKAAQYLASRDF